MSMEAMRAEIEAGWGTTQAAHSAEAILAALAAADSGQTFSFGQLARATGLEMQDAIVGTNVLFHTIGAVEVGYLWNGVELCRPLKLSEVPGINSMDPMAHPVTGEMVADWKSFAVPVVFAAPRLKAALADSRQTPGLSCW